MLSGFALAALWGAAQSARFIIELESQGKIDRAAGKLDGVPGLEIRHRFDSALFPGLSVEGKGWDEERLRAALAPEVAAVSIHPSAQMELREVIVAKPNEQTTSATPNYSVHGLTGVDKLHEAGILGAGATVAIVDSGVYYKHTALGGCFGPDCTVIGGRDLVGDTWSGQGDKEPDSDPIDVFGHGTHVAGIIAGKAGDFSGVAPAAKLLAFKVLGRGGSSNEDLVIAGFLAAFESDADIITASVGERSGFTANALAVVASRIVEQGVMVTFATGNAGQDGPFDASNGAAGEKVLTVGACDPSFFPAKTFSAKVGSETRQIPYLPAAATTPRDSADWPATMVDLAIKPLSRNSSVGDDGCQSIGTGTEFANAIVLVRHGGCVQDVKQHNLAAQGAKYILFYDNGAHQVAYAGDKLLTASIEASTAKMMLDAIAAGTSVTASFNAISSGYVGYASSGGGRPSLYTSWGSTYDLALKPDVAAPGTKILSTYLDDKYQILSGSSMATPYVAGVAALWVGANGGKKVHAARNDTAWAKRLVARITTTATTAPWADWYTSSKDYGFHAPTTQVGAGVINALSVLDYKTELSFTGRKLELNDTAHFQAKHKFDIKNTGSTAVTYKFELQPAGGYHAWLPRNASQTPRLKLYVELQPVEMRPTVVLPAGDFTLGPGETKTAEVSFTAPAGLEAKGLPVYSGKLLVNGSNGEKLGVPYFGVGCDLKATVDVLSSQSPPEISSGARVTPITTKANFTFDLNKDDYPHLAVTLGWGTTEFRWDIFSSNYTEADWVFPPVPGAHGFVGSATFWNRSAETSAIDPAKDDPESVQPFPVRYVPRDTNRYYFWFGKLADGSRIQPGSYRFRVAALRPFGDRAVAADWDVAEFPLATVLPLA